MKMSWYYNNVPLKEYLDSKIINKNELNYIYSYVRRKIKNIVDKNPNIDINATLDNILSEERVQNAFHNDSLTKQHKNGYYYKNIPLKEYIKKNIKSDKKNTEEIYTFIIRRIRINENSNNNDLFIENILNSKDFNKYINTETKIDVAWMIDNKLLVDYVKENYVSSKRTVKQILKQIRKHVTNELNKNNLDNSYREYYIKKYLESDEFRKFINTNPLKYNSYNYKGIFLYQYLKKVVINKDNIDYIYNKVILRVKNECLENDNLDEVIYKVMNQQDIIDMINDSCIIEKQIKESWTYNGGLLIDYLRSINLNNKSVDNVYISIKCAINGLYKSFNSLDEKEKAIGKYLESEEFKRYLKYGDKENRYYYRRMLLTDYIKEHFTDVLEDHDRNPDNLYCHCKRWLSDNYNLDTSIEKIEEYIDEYFNSDVFKKYIISEKVLRENWSYNNVNLKSLIRESYKDIIEDEEDVDKIYSSIVTSALKFKKYHRNIPNEEIISPFFQEEYIKDYCIKFLEKKEINKEVDKYSKLYQNKEDKEYVLNYLKIYNIDFGTYKYVYDRLLDNYSTILLIDYANKFGEDYKYLLKYTLDLLKKKVVDENDMAWLIKLGYKSYVFDLVNKSKGKIFRYVKIYKTKILNDIIYIDYDDVLSFLYELILKKHVSINTSREYFINSFMLFVKGCIKRYIYNLKRNKTVSINSEVFERMNKSTSNDIACNNDIINIINDLDNIEKQFVLLRYGFINDVHSLSEILNIFNDSGIQITYDELKELEENILLKLRSNDKFLKLYKK